MGKTGRKNKVYSAEFKIDVKTFAINKKYTPGNRSVF